MKKLKEFVIAMLVLTVIAGTFALAILQESYRLNPPTKLELEQTPMIIRVLVGGNYE